MRKFGTILSPNPRYTGKKRRELTPTERAAIVTARKLGRLRVELAKAFNCHSITITRTLARFSTYESVKSLPRSGWLKKINDGNIRYIKRLLRRNPRMTWAALQASSGVGCCIMTLRRHLGKYFRRKWRARKRIFLTDAQAAARLQYARFWYRKQQELTEV